MPEKTLIGFSDHGKLGVIRQPDLAYAERELNEFKLEGIDHQALAARLQRDGVQAFAESWRGLMLRIQEKSEQLPPAAARVRTA